MLIICVLLFEYDGSILFKSRNIDIFTTYHWTGYKKFKIGFGKLYRENEC